MRGHLTQELLPAVFGAAVVLIPLIIAAALLG